MSKRRRKSSKKIQTLDHAVETRFLAALESFMQFEAKIDRELEALVAKWQHVAAPDGGAFRRMLIQSARQRKPA